MKAIKIILLERRFDVILTSFSSSNKVRYNLSVRIFIAFNLCQNVFRKFF